MKKIILVFIAIVLIMSCEKHEKACNYDNPLEDLIWLKELKSSFTNCTCQISIIQASYNNETVFYSIMNDPLCNSIQEIHLYDCTGTSVKVYNSPLGETFGNEVTDRKVLYSCTTKK